MLETPARDLTQRTDAEARHDRNDSYHKNTERHSTLAGAFTHTDERKCHVCTIPTFTRNQYTTYTLMGFGRGAKRTRNICQVAEVTGEAEWKRLKAHY
jgi:hypothetical protein